MEKTRITQNLKRKILLSNYSNVNLLSFQELLHKMNQSSFPWFLVIFSVITALGAVVSYDIYTSNNIKGKLTNRIIKPIFDKQLALFGFLHKYMYEWWISYKND